MVFYLFEKNLISHSFNFNLIYNLKITKLKGYHAYCSAQVFLLKKTDISTLA
jgi:hypothetical protein